MSDKGAMRLAYELGKVHGENAKAAEAENKVAPAQKKGKGEYEDYRYASEDKDSFVRMKKELAKKTGLDVLDLNTLTDKDADTVNGLLNMDRGQMAFAEDAENKFGVVIHESLEFASVMSENEYQKLMGVMLNYLVEKHGAEDIHALIESYQRAYEQVEGEKSYEDAAGELINDAVSGVFYDEKGAKNFIDWVMKDAKLDANEKKNVFQEIADLVKHVFEKIKKYIDDTPMTKAARLAAELDVEQKEKIQQLFMDAVDKAGENYKKLDSNNKGEEKEKRGKYSVKVIPDTIQDDIKTNLKDVANMPTVSNVKETEFSKGKIKLVDQVAEFFDDIGNNVYNEMLGDVELSRKGVKDDISHGIGRAKAISFKAIPDIIKNGKIVNYSSNYKGKGHARVVIAAPIEIVGSQEKICGKYIMAVVLRRENAKQRFYMHEVATIKRDELLFKTRTYNKVISNPSNNPSLEEILTNIVGNVKNKDSKMTNEKPTKENKDIRYSISVDLDKQIDDVLNDTVPKDYTHVYLGETTKALKELGWNDLPMLMTNQHVYSVINGKEDKGARYKKIRNYHNLGKEKFMQVLEDIESPWMIIKSNNKENNADLVMVSSVVDKNGNVVIAAVKPNGVGRKKTATLDANIMLSMYGKESLHNYVEKAGRENRIIKVNPDKAVGPTVQFRGNILHQDYKDNLARYKEIVKNIISGEGEKYSLHVSERAEKLRHSLAETMTTEESLVEENEQLKKVVEMLQSEFKPGKKTIPEPARVEAVCKKILKKYHSSFDAETFRDNLTKLYAYMNEEGADYKEALKITSEIARGVLEKSTAKDMTLYNEYKDLREYFRKTKLALSEAQKSEVNYLYGSMGEFRKSNFGRLRIVEDGTSLDQVWGELSDKYPELFKADTNDGDMIAEVMTVLDGLRPTYRNAYGEDIEQASYDPCLKYLQGNEYDTTETNV